MSNAILSVGKEILREEFRELVRRTVQDTINTLIEEDAAKTPGDERRPR